MEVSGVTPRRPTSCAPFSRRCTNWTTKAVWKHGYRRYAENQRLLVDGLRELGIHALIERRYQSPIITSFFIPTTTGSRLRSSIVG